MKRVEEKVKDIVDVRPFTNLNDFTADPAQTLVGYHFTDITADLMAQWLDRIAEVKTGRGAALALAGFRGVGKSHFLATLGALAAHTELRSKVADAHVSTSANRLARRHFPVAYVRRGSKGTLHLELKNAIAELLGKDPQALSDSLNELLMLASQKGGDSPSVLLIDTALGRESRVSRDDGVLLSEIAEAAKSMGMFVAIALDDDIAGADGVNSSIANSFEIHFLDQEHLYKIVDSHIFPKNNQMRPKLHEIYEYYRKVIPGFRWSEQRFSSLYPLHPSILEIAPFVRLYLHDFALLSFAADAGVRIMGRPANSLIALDEVFDNAEKGLRVVDELKDAFQAFDLLDRDIVAKTPVMKRLRAKLILKGLLLSSLDNDGATASDLSAAMMIFDEDTPADAIDEVEQMLNTLAQTCPESIVRSESSERETKYLFRLSGKEDLNAVLAEAIKPVPEEIVSKILRRVMADKFSDLDINEDGVDVNAGCNIVWRGGIRRGKVVWRSRDESGNWVIPTFPGTPLEWLCVINGETSALPLNANAGDARVIEWRLADLRKDEIDAVRRYHVLHSDVELREKISGHVTSAIHSHTIAVDKIWQRIYLRDSVIVIDGLEYNLTEEARSSHSLSQLFAIMLDPMLLVRFPLHPSFTQVLGIKEVSGLIGDLFGGAAPNTGDVQQLAEIFASPLGLVANQNGHFIPEPVESLLQLPAVQAAFNSAESDTEVISLAEIYSRLGTAPYGYTREAQHLILAALVAQRQFEFVTSSGNRINRRSLDLQIIWDDIIGIARPSDDAYSNERLGVWASLLTGRPELKSLETEDGRKRAVDALTEWHTNWEFERTLQRFDAISDENLNARIWRIAANVKKTFEVIAELVAAVIQNPQSLEKCLQSIADVFSDSEEEFENRKSDLSLLEAFTRGSTKRNDVIAYLSLAETTADAAIEDLREQLMLLASDCNSHPIASSTAELDNLWSKYKAQYSALYIASHDAVMNSPEIRDKFEQITRTDIWNEFYSFSTIPVIDPLYAKGARSMLGEFRRLGCNSETSELLREKPFCSCAFRLSKTAYLENLPDQFWKIVNQGHEAFRRFLKEEKITLIRALNDFAAKVEDPETISALDNLISIAKHEGEFGRFSVRELQIVNTAITNLANVEAHFGNGEFLSRNAPDEWFPTEFITWEKELDG